MKARSIRPADAIWQSRFPRTRSLWYSTLALPEGMSVASAHYEFVTAIVLSISKWHGISLEFLRRAFASMRRRSKRHQVLTASINP
jgi:hypothetical protein